MNLGIERFLILGCVAVLILELPEVLTDLRLGDGFPGADAPVAQVVELPIGLESDVLAKLVAREPVARVAFELQPVRLPMTPGL